MVEISQLDYYDKLERKYLDIKLKTTNIKQELGSYEKIMQILFDHMDENLSTQKSVSQKLGNNNTAVDISGGSFSINGGASKEGSNVGCGGASSSVTSSSATSNTVTTNSASSANSRHNSFCQDDDIERKQNALKESYEKLSNKYERLRVAKIEREDEYKRCLGEKVQLETHLNSMKTQVSTLKKLREFSGLSTNGGNNGSGNNNIISTPLKQNNQENHQHSARSSVSSSNANTASDNQRRTSSSLSLSSTTSPSPSSASNVENQATVTTAISTTASKQQQHHNQTETDSLAINTINNKEQRQQNHATAHNKKTASSSPGASSNASTTTTTNTSYDYDVETINFLNECNWNLGDSCDRSLAESLLGCFPSGTFLVRSARKKQQSFALSVVANSKVQHCLIDKLDEGYCFHPPGPAHQVYPGLCDLVMDYRHKSLLIHHKELDTNLIYPVLSQIKKTSRG